MNKILERIFKNSKPDFSKLKAYGFAEYENAYCYSTKILDSQFLMRIAITDNDIQTELIDLATNEPYTLYLVDDASGSFVGSVRTAYQNVMQNIANNCFNKNVFTSEYAKKIIEYVSVTYGDSLEFLWEKFSGNAIWRRQDNKKWYALLLTVMPQKLGLPCGEKIEILDLRASSENIDNIINDKTIFRGYHMNKKHWITILLDGSISLDNIKKLLSESYNLAGKA